MKKQWEKSETPIDKSAKGRDQKLIKAENAPSK